MQKGRASLQAPAPHEHPKRHQPWRPHAHQASAPTACLHPVLPAARHCRRQRGPRRQLLAGAPPGAVCSLAAGAARQRVAVAVAQSPEHPAQLQHIAPPVGKPAGGGGGVGVGWGCGQVRERGGRTAFVLQMRCRQTASCSGSTPLSHTDRGCTHAAQDQSTASVAQLAWLDTRAVPHSPYLCRSPEPAPAVASIARIACSPNANPSCGPRPMMVRARRRAGACRWRASPEKARLPPARYTADCRAGGGTTRWFIGVAIGRCQLKRWHMHGAVCAGGMRGDLP